MHKLTVKALISTAVADAMAELVPQLERASGHTLRITYGPTGYDSFRVGPAQRIDAAR